MNDLNAIESDVMNIGEGSAYRCCRLSGFIMLVCLGMLLGAGRVRAGDTEAGLAAAEETALLDAVRRRDMVAVQAIVIAAIARKSDDTTEIIRDLYKLAPAHVDIVLKAARETFPDLADRITAVADEVVQEESGDHPGVQDEIAEAEPQYWSGEVAVGGSYRQAATNASTVTVSAKVKYAGDLWEHRLSGSLDYGRTNGVTDTHRLVLDAKTQRQLSDSIYLFGLGEYEDDRFSGFDYQVTEGGGLGYKVFDTPVFKLNVEGGPSVRHSKVTATQDVNDEILARVAMGLEWNISDSASFTNETSLYLAKGEVDIVTDGNAEIDNEQEASNLSVLDMKIVSNLSARLSYDLRYRSNPPVGAPATTSLAKFMMVQSF